MTLKRTVALCLVAGGLAAAGTLATRTPAWAANNGKDEAGEGKYADLTATWWQWIYAQPAADAGATNTNPNLDSTGAYAAAGQAGGIGPGNKFFFLAGTFGGDAERNVTVPAHKDLFFPVVNTEYDNAVDPVTHFGVPYLRGLAKANVDAATIHVATVDGNPIEVFRTKSPAFSYTLPAQGNIYAYFGLVGPQFEGTVKPVCSDGWWAYVPALSAGAHTIHFHGETSNGFELDVVDHLTVQ
jgi:hypothetical protein